MKVLVFNILLILNFSLFSQNLVVDGSFEDYYKCPSNIGSFELIYWIPVKSPDYYNVCDSLGYKRMNIPRNIGGYQVPKSGNGYSGFYLFQLYNVQQQAGEFIETKLKDSLKKGKCYKTVFFVSIQESASNYAIKEIGAFFSENQIYNEVFADTIVPQILNSDSIIDDTLYWKKIQGDFISKGGEQFITIGNFFIKRPVTYQSLPWGTTNTKAFYYIDAVAVYPCDDLIYTANTIKDTTLCHGNSISPGLTQVESQYKAEYEWFWYESGKEKDTLSTEQFPVFQPDTSTTYVLKLTDFKFDVSYDTVRISVVDCKEPTILKVFPNPTKDKVFFEFNSIIPANMSIEIYNLMGQKIISNDYRSNRDIKTLEINLQSQANGLYFYRVIIGNETKFNGKLIKI